jgi:hypothetical protein
MSDQVSAVRARQQEIERLKWLLENASAAPWCLDDHVVHPGDSPNQWHIYERLEDDPPLFTTGMGTRDDAELVVLLRNLAPDLLPIVEAAFRAVPLSAEPEGLRDKIADAWWAGRQSVRQWSVESASGPQLIAACDDLINKLLAAPTVAQAPRGRYEPCKCPSVYGRGECVKRSGGHIGAGITCLFDVAADTQNGGRVGGATDVGSVESPLTKLAD